MDEIHVHKTKKSICAHFAESPCNSNKAKTTAPNSPNLKITQAPPKNVQFWRLRIHNHDCRCIGTTTYSE